MLIPQKISKKKTILLIVVIILILAVVLYLLFNYFFTGKIKLPLAKVTVNLDLLAMPVIETEFKDDFLTQEPYFKLERHGLWPVEVGQMGRKNPFSIFETEE